MASAIFVLVKLRSRQRLILQHRCSRTRTDDDFKKLVAFVGLLFCCSHVFVVIDLVNALIVDDRLTATESCFRFWTYFTGILNSSVNLLIYVATSQNFRVTLISYWKKVFTMRK